VSKTILVTGPTGKVGRRLIPLLAPPGDDRPCRQSVARHGQDLASLELEQSQPRVYDRPIQMRLL
jgi:hypothetical protein